MYADVQSLSVPVCLDALVMIPLKYDRKNGDDGLKWELRFFRFSPQIHLIHSISPPCLGAKCKIHEKPTLCHEFAKSRLPQKIQIINPHQSSR